MNIKNCFSVILITALFCGNAFSQEQGKFRVAFDIGYTTNQNCERSAPVFRTNFGYNLQDNMNVGARIGYSRLLNVDRDLYGLETHFECTHKITKFLGTYTYNFVWSSYFGTSSFVPFVGGGLGVYIMDMYVNYSFWDGTFTFSGSPDKDLYTKIGGFLTAGFELWRFRLAAEYFLVPTSNVTIEGVVRDEWGNLIRNENHNIDIKNSHYGFSVGFYFGGGSRRASK